MRNHKGVKEHADHNLEDWDSEVKFGTLSGEDYANLRLGGHLQLFEEEADKLDKRLLVYKIATYAIGVVGGFLSFLSLEVRIARANLTFSFLVAFAPACFLQHLRCLEASILAQVNYVEEIGLIA